MHDDAVVVVAGQAPKPGDKVPESDAETLLSQLLILSFGGGKTWKTKDAKEGKRILYLLYFLRLC